MARRIQNIELKRSGSPPGLLFQRRWFKTKGVDLKTEHPGLRGKIIPQVAIPVIQIDRYIEMIFSHLQAQNVINMGMCQYYGMQFNTGLRQLFIESFKFMILEKTGIN